MTTNAKPQPMTADEETAILIRLAQRYAVDNLPRGVRLSEATRPQLAAAIKKGIRNR